MTGPRRFAVTLLAAALLAACGGAGDSTDRAGNPTPPLVLRLGSQEHEGTPAAQLVTLFADEVAQRSDGAVRIDATFSAAGEGAAWDQRMIELAAAGEFDLVVARSGAWPRAGADSLEVLQLPGVIESDEQADRIVADTQLVDGLLAGLPTLGFVGLGLYPEAPRYLMLLDETDDFGRAALRDRVVRAPLDDAVFAALRAAGMSPVDMSAGDFLDGVSSGAVSATEGQFTRVALTSTITGRSDAAVAANMPLYTKFLVLAARGDVIDDATMGLLRESALSVVGPFSSDRPREADGVLIACAAGGRLVVVPSDDRARFMSAVQVVVDEFESGPDGELLRQVRSVAGTADRVGWTCPEGGTAGTPPTSTSIVPESVPWPISRDDIVPFAGQLPDGVYRFTETSAALDEAGAPATDEPFIGEWTLRGGRAELRYFLLDGTPQPGEPPDVGGTYHVVGDLVVFATPPERAIPGTDGVYLLRWVFEGDTLSLQQIDQGRRDPDFLVPWIRVGAAPDS